jgi:SAM-dependent methyltransferase
VLTDGGFVSTTEINTFLDIGCGEGFALNFFKDKGWEVLGLDYTSGGCKLMNPDCLKYVIEGNIFSSIENLISDKKLFSVIWIDNVLEHVTNPFELISKSKKLLKKNGVLVIEVPNDFSIIQQHALNNNYIDNEFWVVVPEHLSYFNKEGLINLLDNAGYANYLTLGDFPIDINLFNSSTNYVMNKSVGKAVHKARVETEILIHEQSIEKANKFFEALADLGMGRSIISFFVHR